MPKTRCPVCGAWHAPDAPHRNRVYVTTPPEVLIERRRVDEPDGCQSLGGSRKKYPSVGGRRTRVSVCRFLLGLEVGDHHECCHTCDNPWCINPDHLYIGTIDDNIDDMIERGRSNRGERHWNWKGGVSKNYRTGANRRKGPDDKPFDDRRTVWKT